MATITVAGTTITEDQMGQTRDDIIGICSPNDATPATAGCERIKTLRVLAFSRRLKIFREGFQNEDRTEKINYSRLSDVC